MSIEYAVILAIANPNHISALTKSRPHAMLPALGKPMVVRVMNQLLLAGIKKFVVVVGINEGSVASYLNAHWVPNVELDFVLKSDHESLSSTLGQIARKLNQPFFIATYNMFVHPQFVSGALTFANNNLDLLILAGANATLSQNSYYAFANVDENDTVLNISQSSQSDDSSYLVANLAVCGTSFIQFLQELSSKLGTGSLQQQLVDILMSYAKITQNRIMLRETAWIMEVNNDADLMLLNYQLLEDGRDAHILSEVPASVHIHYPVRIDPGVNIGQEAEIGPYVYLESGTSIGNRAKVRRSIVLDRASIPQNANVENVVMAPKKVIASSAN